MCGYFCIGLLLESLLEYTNLFSQRIQKERQNNIKIYSMMKIYSNVCDKYRKLKKS